MGTGSLAMMLLIGGLGGPADGPIAMKERSISIPYNLSVAPVEVSEVVLFVSIDQGKVWSRAGVIKPTEKSFNFQAPTDGTYWFNIAVVYRNGTQVPADVSQTPPQQRVLIDTQKPAVRLNSAERVGNEIQVAWEIQETNPDLASLKLEYRPADGSAGGYWTPAQVSPGLFGQAKFAVNSSGPMTVRLSMADTAGSTGSADRTTSGATTGVNPLSPITQQAAYNGVTPLPAPSPSPVPSPVEPQVVVPPAAPVVTSLENAPNVPLATSNRNDARNAPAPPAPAGLNHTTFRPEQPDIYHTNEPQVTVDYEIERQGPSGVSKVEVYMTQDEGKTWMKWQDLSRNDAKSNDPLANNKLPVTVRLPEREGLYGYRLVPYSGTQMSAGPPANGDEPEFRIQYDKSAPYVELFKPEADPNQLNALNLQWRATDPNLTTAPIRIFWAEKLEGEWKPVNGGEALTLANNGRYAWILPPGIPYKVFLKIVAEDKAGNIGEAITSQPVAVDVHKPVGRFKGIVESKKRN